MAGEKHRMRSKPAEDLYISAYTKSWGERLTFTVGTSYIMGGFLGLLQGSYRGLAKAKQSKYKRVSHVFSAQGKMALRGGNAFGSASLLYVLTGKMIELVFEEEVEDFGDNFRCGLAGGVAGGLFKSTLGRRPMVVGSLLGALLAVGINNGINYLNSAGLIGFKGM